MVKIYYNTLSDYNNQNKFNDLVEGNNNAEYNAFLSSSSVDLYYKVNDRLQTINLRAADVIPLGLNGMRLLPVSFTVQKVNNNGIAISYDSTTNTQTITTI
jgi:hypothetical protein